MCEMQRVVKHKDLIYDVGMHKGEDTDYYLKKGFRVIGFEAEPDLAALCRDKFSDEIENGKVVIIEGAITDSASAEEQGRTTQFFKNNDKSAWGTVSSEWARKNEFLGTSNTVIEVPVVDFTYCLKHYGIPYFLKIDIEGMDIVCLESLTDFEQRPDYISIESDKVSFGKLVQELNLLMQLGYTGFKAIQQKNIAHQKEPSPAKEGCYVGHQFKKCSSGLFGADLPGEWRGYEQIINEYIDAFIQYKFFGNYGIFSKYFVGHVFRKIISILLRKPISGWYDTHAKHASVVS